MRPSPNYFDICFTYTHLDLAFRHAECEGKSGSFGPRQVLGLFECFLQSEYLVSGERRPGVFPLRTSARGRFVGTPGTWAAESWMIAECWHHSCSEIHIVCQENSTTAVWVWRTKSCLVKKSISGQGHRNRSDRHGGCRTNKLTNNYF